MSATSLLIQPLHRTPRLQVTKPRPRVAVQSYAPPTPTMPLLTRESLAHRFRQNWMAKHPSDVPSPNTVLDDSLTSLNWLQNLNIMKMATPTPPASPEPQLKALMGNKSCDYRVDPNAVLNMTNIPVLKAQDTVMGMTTLSQLNCKLTAPVDVAPPTPTTPTMDKIDYKSNPYVKPPYSYATLICMAMRESKKNKITLSGIYNWITDNFMYYRVADPSWQNSIRHNLSLNKCFQKVPRRKDEPGKGGFWRINPEYSDMFVNGIFKKRRSTARETITSPPLKKIKREMESDFGVLGGGIGSLTPQNSLQDMEALEETMQLRLAPVDEGDDTLRGDFNWNAILHQDIEVGGVSIKTEDIIDGEASQQELADGAACPITALSPPPSDSNSDVALEDLLNAADLAGVGVGDPTYDHDPVDLSTSALDLTVQGAGIRPPDWWSESMNKDLMQKAFMSPDHETASSGMHTPLAPSPAHDVDLGDYSHPWAESRAELDEAIASFDLDLQNLFDDDLAASFDS